MYTNISANQSYSFGFIFNFYVVFGIEYIPKYSYFRASKQLLYHRATPPTLFFRIYVGLELILYILPPASQVPRNIDVCHQSCLVLLLYV